uniref:Uncharacterized protein n=1 Tax=Arundo donax TaxID=35708 RepID=A0A0A9ANK9_ARUDO
MFRCLVSPLCEAFVIVLASLMC